MALTPALPLALAFLRGGRRARLLPAALVAFASATLVVTLAVARGFDASFTAKLLLATGHLRVRAADGEGFADHIEAVAAFRAAGHRAAARFAGECVLESSGFSAGVRAVGVNFPDEADVAEHISRYNDIIWNESSGDGPPPVVVGARLAREARLAAGDTLRLRGTVAPAEFRVAGTFSVGLADYDYSFVYLPLSAAARLFDYPELATEIVFSLDDPDAAPAVASAIEREYPGTVAESWQERNAALVATLAVERFALRLLVALVAALALAGVALLTLASLDERRRAVGVLSAFGMSMREIRAVFLAEGFLLSAFGLASGLALGLASCELLARIAIPLPEGFAQTYAAERLPVRVVPADPAYIALAFLTLAALAAWLATARLARLTVRDLMR